VSLLSFWRKVEASLPFFAGVRVFQNAKCSEGALICLRMHFFLAIRVFILQLAYIHISGLSPLSQASWGSSFASTWKSVSLGSIDLLSHFTFSIEGDLKTENLTHTLYKQNLSSCSIEILYKHRIDRKTRAIHVGIEILFLRKHGCSI
jgi:hypothetical protein